MKDQTNLFFQDDDDPSDENLEDLQVGRRNLSSSVVYNTDWTVETITRQVEKGSIDLSPSFQRRDAWPQPKKSLLIESILLNFPVPPLTLAEKGSSKTYVVVDGKQRLTTLSQFFGLMPNSKNNSFKLTGLREISELNGFDIEGIRENFPAYYLALENYSIRTNVIRGWHKDDVLYSIFLRLNSGSVKLSPQELRQALHPGPFADWLASYTEGSPALRAIFPGHEPDFRMRDMEIMIRYLAFNFFLDEYRGDLKKFLDGAAATLNSEWANYEKRIERQAHVFEDAHQAVVQVFGTEHAYRKWSGDHFEGRLNRAVFDVMMFHLVDQGTIASFRDKGNALVERFKELCVKSPVFRDAIEATTKSVDAVTSRLGLWGLTLEKLGVDARNVNINGIGFFFDDAER